MEIHAERLVLDLVPSDADTEADAAGREQRKCCNLFGDERALALGQHGNVGDELE